MTGPEGRTAGSASRRDLLRAALHGISRYGIFGALALLFVLLCCTVEGFATARNLDNVLRQNSFTAILAIGMTLTILTGGIDLSIGSVVALAGVACVSNLIEPSAGWTGAVLGTVLAVLVGTRAGAARGARVGWLAAGAGLGVGLAMGALAAALHPLLAGVLIGVGAGAGVGLANGLLITRVRVPPFLATLGLMQIVRGAARLATDARTVQVPESLAPDFAGLADGSTPVVVLAFVTLAAWLMLTRTPFGRHLYAVGGNREAARLAGIRVHQVLLGVYVLCGAAAGLAGVLVAARIGAGYPNAGLSYELDAVAATVVGGTSLFGGRGSVWGTLAGAFFIGILNNGLNLLGVQEYLQDIVKGVVLVVAIALNLLLDRWRGGAPA